MTTDNELKKLQAELNALKKKKVGETEGVIPKAELSEGDRKPKNLVIKLDKGQDNRNIACAFCGQRIDEGVNK